MASASLEELEGRVASLEAALAALLAANKPAREKDWRRTLGMFSGDEGMREIFDEAKRIRDADRAQAASNPNYFEGQLE